MGFFFMVIMFCVGAGLVAKGKNRNILGWSLAALVIGPFALLILALIKPGPGPDQGYQ